MAVFGSFLYGSGVLYGASSYIYSASPVRGPSTGGNAFVLTGSGFTFTSWDDDFTAGALDGALWTDISSGGTFTTGSTHLTLSTGSTPGQTAAIESVPTVNNFQYEISVNVPRIRVYPTSTVRFIATSYYIDANNYAEMSINVGTTSSDITLSCTTVLGGATTSSYEIPWTTGVSTLRLLRWMNRVYFIANGSVVHVSTGFNFTTATYRIFSANDSAAYDVSGVVVNYYESKPYAVFGDTPVFDTVVVSSNRVRGTVPPSLDSFGVEAGYAGLITVYYVGNVVASIVDGYEYYYEKSLVLVDNQQTDLVLSIIDPIVRTPADVRRGL